MERSNLKDHLSRPRTWLGIIFLGLTVTAYAAVNSFDNLKANKLNVDNIQLDGNVLSTTNANGDLTVTPNGTGGIILSPLTATTVPYLDSSKKLTSSSATPTQLGYLANTTSTLCGINQACTITNKTIDGASNSITLSTTSITSGTLPVSRGGTGSVTALNNNRIMQSSSGNIVEAAAITASRALASDSNGIPTASSVTSTELGYLSGVTSALQTQINAKGAGTVTNITATNTASSGLSISNGSTTPNITLSNILTLGAGSVGTGRLELYGTSSGSAVKIRPNDSTGSYNFNLPTSAGTSGDVLTSGGGLTSDMTWSTPTSSVSANAIVKRDSSGYLRGDIADSSGNRMFDTTNGFIRNSGGTVLADMTGAYLQMTQGMRLINPTLAPAITLQSNSAGSAYTFTFPPNGGTSGFVLTTDGSGTTSWTTASAGTVTNVSGTAPVSVSNGTTTPTISVPTSSLSILNVGIAASVSSNALTIALKQADASTDCSTGSAACYINFRSSTLTSGASNLRSITGALSTVISSGSTAGHTSGVNWNLWIYAIDNAGTVELAWSSFLQNCSGLQTTTAEGGAGAADSPNILYSTTARSNVPCRLIGKLLSNQATAGTWASTMTSIVMVTGEDMLHTGRVAWTPTGAWSTNTTYTGYYWIDRDWMHLNALVSLSGAPTTASFTLNLPSGFAIDTNRLIGGSSANRIVQHSPAQIVSAGNAYMGQIRYNSTTSINLSSLPNSTSNQMTGVDQATPATFANGDLILLDFSIPITGW